jgi:hypothetical protein
MTMRAIPAGQAALTGILHNLFRGQSGLITRQLQPPGGPAVTIFYLQDLVAPADLERLVLVPLGAGALRGAPLDLARSGRFPAPMLETADDANTLRDWLLDGLTAIHLEGYPSVLLVGSGASVQSAPTFGHDLDANRIALCRCLRREDWTVEELGGTDNTRPLLVYLRTAARPSLLREVRKSVDQLTVEPGKLPGWRALLNLFRLPQVLECSSPALAAVALRGGYVAVLLEHGGGPYLAPVSLELLWRSSRDVGLQPFVRRALVSWRILAAFAGATIGAWLIAFTAYHLAVLPGPFLMAVAVSRQNMPFPIAAEMFLVSFLGDVAEAAAIRTGGQRTLLLAWIGTVLAIMAGMQVGVIGAMSGLAAVAAMVLRIALPNESLRRLVRVWRYLFMVAGAGLGVYGISLLGFAMLVYLGNERSVGHLVRLAPDGVGQ